MIFVLGIFSARSNTFINVELDSRVVVCTFCSVRSIDGYNPKNDTISFRFFQFAKIEPVRFVSLKGVRVDRDGVFENETLALTVDGTEVVPGVVYARRARGVVSHLESPSVLDSRTSGGVSSIQLNGDPFSDFESCFYSNLFKLSSLSGEMRTMEDIREAMRCTRQEMGMKSIQTRPDCDGEVNDRKY